MSLIHRYQNNGYNIVLDINSGCIHLVDLVTYEVLPYMEEGLNAEEIVSKLKDRFPEEDIRTSVSECEKLKEQGMLFTRDAYENVIEEFTKNRQTVVKALCLHIAHDCNLACRYCFAEEGEYHGRRALMSFEVGKKALDFLIANSGSRRNLEVDFFGGEPLMNWQVVKDLVAYGREQEKLHNKKFRFTLTTNGVLLNDEVMEFCNREMGNVVLSVDGRKEVHDFMRPFRKGAGSYDLVIPKFQKFAESRNHQGSKETCRKCTDESGSGRRHSCKVHQFQTERIGNRSDRRGRRGKTYRTVEHDRESKHAAETCQKAEQDPESHRKGDLDEIHRFQMQKQRHDPGRHRCHQDNDQRIHQSFCSGTHVQFGKVDPACDKRKSRNDKQHGTDISRLMLD